MPKLGNWTYGGVTIVVEDDSEDYIKPRIGQLNVLDSEHDTIAHFAGTESAQRDLKFVMFSGFQNLFLPLIDGEYHELVSDQGSEGDYIVMSCDNNRLQDLSRVTEVYRANVTLKKESPSDTYVLVATRDFGLYQSDDFVFDDNSNPTWTQIGDQISNMFQVDFDRNDARDVQVGFTEDKTVHIRRPDAYGDNWQQLLDESDIKSITGQSGDVQIGGIAYNSENPGHIYLTVSHGISSGVYFLKSTDYGQNWSSIALYEGIFSYNAGGISISYKSGTYDTGDVIWACLQDNTGGPKVAVSTDLGANWTIGSATTGGAWRADVEASPSSQESAFTGRSTNGEYLHRCDDYNPSSYTNLAPGSIQNGFSVENISDILISSDGQIIYTIYAGTLWMSTDAGSSWNSEASVISAAAIDGYLTNDQVLLGQWLGGIEGDPHTLRLYLDSGSTEYGKSGANADTATTGGGDSIPYDCGGIARKGVIISEV